MIILVIILVWMIGYLLFENRAMAMQCDKILLTERIEINKEMIESLQESIRLYEDISNNEKMIEITKEEVLLIKKENKLLERMTR